MRLVELAKTLVGFNTITLESGTASMADFISNFLSGYGFSIHQYPYTDTNKLSKTNLVAVKGEGLGPVKLAFSGHMDTVNVSPWTAPGPGPFTLTKVDDLYYGRGIADMKLFLAMAMLAGSAIPESDLKHPFALIFTSDEEYGCLGAKRLLRNFPDSALAEWIVVGEPTEMRPVFAHKGYIYKTISLVANVLSGHSSHPKNGTDVVKRTLPKLLSVLGEMKKHLEEIRDKRFDPPFPTMNIGVVTTDGTTREVGRKKVVNVKSAKNYIPGYCRVELEIRPVPGQDVSEIVGILEKLVTDSITIPKGEVRFDENNQRAPSIPMETPEDSPFLKLIEEISQEKIETASYNTEGGLFNRSGSQTVIWGPGSISQAHKSNEYVHQRYMSNRILDMYTELIHRTCCRS